MIRWSSYVQRNQNSVKTKDGGMVGPFGRLLPLCFDRVMVLLLMGKCANTDLSRSLGDLHVLELVLYLEQDVHEVICGGV